MLGEGQQYSGFLKVGNYNLLMLYAYVHVYGDLGCHTLLRLGVIARWERHENGRLNLKSEVHWTFKKIYYNHEFVLYADSVEFFFFSR